MGFTALMNATLTHHRATDTSDNMGGYTKTWASQGDFKGRISPIRAQESFSQGKTWANATHRIFMEYTSLLVTDRVIFGSRTFEVLGIVNPSESGHHREVLVQELA